MRKMSIKMDRQKSNETSVNHLLDIVPGKNQPLSADSSHHSHQAADKKQPFAKRLGHRIGKIFGKH